MTKIYSNRVTVSYIDSFVGSKIQEIRTFCGISREELEVALGLPEEQLRLIECGLVRLDADKLLDLSNMLDKAPSWFFPK